MGHTKNVHGNSYEVLECISPLIWKYILIIYDHKRQAQDILLLLVLEMVFDNTQMKYMVAEWLHNTLKLDDMLKRQDKNLIAFICETSSLSNVTC